MYLFYVLLYDAFIVNYSTYIMLYFKRNIHQIKSSPFLH